MISLKLEKYDKRTTHKPIVKILFYNPLMNKEVESPHEYFGIVDTGSDITCICERVINELLLSSVSESILCNDISGNPENTNIRQIDINIPGLMSDYLTLDVGYFKERKQRPNEKPVRVLIGRDILKNCLTTYNGPAEQMTIEWKI